MQRVEFKSAGVPHRNPDRLFVCAFCCYRFRLSSHLKRCRGCKLVRYCSLEHHRSHWPVHRAFCHVYAARKTTASERVFLRMLFPVYLPVPRDNYISMRELLHKMVRTYQGGMVTVPLLESIDDALRVFNTLLCLHASLTLWYPALVGKVMIQFYYLVTAHEVNHLVFGVGIKYSDLLHVRPVYNQLLESKCLFRLHVMYNRLWR